MAPISKKSEKEDSNNVSQIEQEPDISDSEIDLSKKVKSSKTGSKEVDVLEATRVLRDPTTPKRPKAGTGMQYLTPRSLESSPLKSQTSTPGNEDNAAPKTPNKKARGVFGTDARVWSADGYKSPCRSQPCFPDQQQGQQEEE
ncbi:uncharacterized protein MYCFIDRAFT_76254 [Pseudocercospora fijiensis CIRAD86]|uniref:Uncharacterized protein n=1 Tax=Pseudocercospora fijiensis (strain CIRAD86) TaxID=383855 RepID=N1QC25_PSEFD|nr:uncharacterized protein MYCFIDRAFT_76254 [Pseudocercospora fijiensis CIRAD86]EME88872.1 hypothetical protein MYCFIDRAFT_76254 [Pseudocercospora fijiensis CIRAD86]